MDARIDDHYDCIVIGSGFGGSVMAHRLAAAGKSVLVLERGKKFAPGDFPRTPLENFTNVWDPESRLYGLFDVWSFKKFEAIVSSGLGGGSLIYANVLMRRPAQWFDPRWPVSRVDLDQPYWEVEQVLGVNCYPPEQGARKFDELSKAAVNVGMTWEPAPIAVSFSPDTKPKGLPLLPIDNLHKTPRSTCISCGQCDAGCNTGSKNSLDLTYLSMAETSGACIEALHDVRRIRPLPGVGYEVEAVRHVPPEPAWERNGHRPVPERKIFRARCVVLAAGALGSTYLLLRNRVQLPRLSRCLGTRFSGNGDFLGLIRTGSETVLEPSRGPVITGYVRHGSPPGGADPVRGHVVQDGGYPALFGWLGETLGIKPIKRVANVGLALGLARLSHMARTRVSRRVSEAIGDAKPSRGMIPMLGMGLDDAAGVMRLRRGDLDIDWEHRFSEPAFADIRTTMQQLAEGMGGTFAGVWSTWLSRSITVHPLGGAPMATDVDHGVVDPYGEVFDYPGLFVADGAVMPGPVGVNPSLTIAALAHRFADQVINRIESAP